MEKYACDSYFCWAERFWISLNPVLFVSGTLSSLAAFLSLLATFRPASERCQLCAMTSPLETRHALPGKAYHLSRASFFSFCSPVSFLVHSRSSPHVIRFILLQCVVQWFLVYLCTITRASLPTTQSHSTFSSVR